MKPAEFLNTIYLGDRACKSIFIDGWNEKVELQVDTISRIRSESGNWEFYADEDIGDGRIVFSSAKSIKFSPCGPIPNDLINSFEVYPFKAENEIEDKDSLYVFQLSIGSIDPQGTQREVVVEIVAKAIHLEDPKRPGIAITV